VALRYSAIDFGTITRVTIDYSNFSVFKLVLPDLVAVILSIFATHLAIVIKASKYFTGVGLAELSVTLQEKISYPMTSPV